MGAFSLRGVVKMLSRSVSLLIYISITAHAVPHADSGDVVTLAAMGCGKNQPFSETGDTCVARCAEGRAPDDGQVCRACTDDTYADHDDHRCVDTCPTNSPYRTTGNDCVSKCPTGQTADSDSLECVSCSNGKYAYYAENSCVDACPAGWIGTAEQDCVECSGSTPFTDPKSQKCVVKCAGDVYFQFSATKGCEGDPPPEHCKRGICY